MDTPPLFKGIYPLAGPCSIGQSVWAVSPMIQRRSSSESQGRAVWPSCTWPRYPPARDEGELEPHMTRRGVKASMTRPKSSCSGGGRSAEGARLGLTLEAHALHATLVHPIRELVRGIGRRRVQNPHGDRTRGVLFGAVALVGVIEAVGGVGLHQRHAIHAGPVHLRDQVLDVVADLSGPSPCAGVEWVLDSVAAH